MLFECATIIDKSDRSLTVRSRRGSACARCERGEGCGGGIIGQLVFRRQPSLTMTVADTQGFSVGQSVELSLSPQRLMGLAAATYLIPLAATLIGGAIGHAMYASDPAAIAGAVAGLVVTLGILRHHVAPRLERYLVPVVRPTSAAR